jgi:hypothetical protein
VNKDSVIVIAAGVTMCVGWIWLNVSRAKAILRSWAAEAGFQVLNFQMKYIDTGPFKWWTNGRGQVVYRVRVRDDSGKERSGWVRCGAHFGGVIFSKESEVRWDEAIDG